MGVADLHVARHDLNESHEVLQFRSDVVYGKGGRVTEHSLSVSGADTLGFSQTRVESNSVRVLFSWCH